MLSVTVKDFADFRQKARQLLREGHASADIFWADESASEPSLLSAARSEQSGATTRTLNVPVAYIELGETVATHTSAKRWSHLYRLLEKIAREGAAIMNLAVDEDVNALQIMAKQIRRDIHKMHAFVRFRKKTIQGQDLFIAWYEPDHAILKQAAPFFERRFGAMEWIIATPRGAAYWNKKTLQYHFAQLKRQEYEQESDEFESYWLSYYAHIFNPARIKIDAMKKEMPVRFWKNLPEAKLINNLIEKAPSRITEMHDRMARETEQTAEPFLPNDGGPPQIKNKQIERLRAAALECQGCPLYGPATQTVFGHGDAEAPVVIVGEQPGNEEDLNGKPFSGPAGQLLRKALKGMGIKSQNLYFTNAVKHFHFEERGPVRLHKTPKTSHVRACKPWLARELRTIKPKLIVCLGATASQSIIGFPLNMNRDRGRIFKTEFAPQTLVTFHPSYLLRVQDAAEKKKLFAQFVSDLGIIKLHEKN